ncbi:hypothetical protein N7481_011843 [Penicillium waksmanii]|uniref:uncharacterized protein n=1 Tax=Penicillium waksmanii TaxID=69791 RepID=UPI0025493E34|nr:uncharacterized protein N7481_011843 [Penicillium waksmanii]KAJ5974633.1 hypothetical protein N7481_011843 [Penicillium waksmanii]
MSSISFGSNNWGMQVGNNYGAIYLPPDQQKAPPQPCSTVPFQKDTMFVGREAVIRAIKEKQTATGQRHERVALVGLAGVGKTQTAIEYSYHVRESTPDTWVFWIHASSAARLEQGYQQIAAVAKIPGRDNPNMNLLQLVYQWLCDPGNGRWLMVLDNVDDDGVFFSGNEYNDRGPRILFLPQAVHGSILTTSRNELAARNLIGKDGHVIEIQPMNEEESLTLLRARIPASQSGGSGEDEKALVQVLEYIPLAITQAGSYIANRSPRVSVSRYLQLFRESDSNQTHLLQHEDAKDLRRDPSIRHAIITTWQLSFEQIHRERPAATDLLALISMFDRQGIPESLVRADDDELQFEDALAPLISYSLVRIETETASFDMHRLVQLSVRKWLEIHLELVRWQEKSRAIMAQMFPSGHYETWTECRRLLPHAKEVIKSVSDVRGDQMHAATISFHCGWYLMLQGTYKEAQFFQKSALDANERLFGLDDPKTLLSASNFGNVLLRQGKHEEAQAMHQRVLETRTKVLGCEHRRTLFTINYLGLVFSGQMKYEEAEAMHRRALKVREKVFGCEHPDTLTSINDLGNVLSNQGKYKEAESMHQRVLEAREKSFGREDPETLTTVNDFGMVLFRQGKYREAEAMHRRAFETREKVLGREHPYTLTSARDLGLDLSHQGNYPEAEVMHRQALEGRKEVLGREDPSTLTSVSDLGNVLLRQGKYEEAEAMHQWAFEIREKVLGYDHPHTLTSANDLGLVLSTRGRYREAEAMHRRALEARERVLGLEHPGTLTTVNDLGLAFFRQHKYREAESMYRRALEGREKALGRENPQTLISINDLGNILSSQGKFEEAEAMHRRVLETRERVLGREHPGTLTTVNDLGLDLFRQERYKEAEEMHRRALEAREKVLGRKHPHTLITIDGLSNILSSQGKYKEAEAIRGRAFEA